MKTIAFRLNGRPAKLRVDDPEMPLRYALRDDLGLHGPRFGCGLGQCGACTVHVEGEAVRSCVLPVASVANKRVATLEGLGTPEHPHPLERCLCVDLQSQLLPGDERRRARAR